MARCRCWPSCARTSARGGPSATSTGRCVTPSAPHRRAASRWTRSPTWRRAGIIGENGSKQELREASLTVRDLFGRLDLTFGRFMVPGGFWLIADGAMARIRYTGWLEQSVYGGLRAFTTGRRNLDLTTDSP